MELLGEMADIPARKVCAGLGTKVLWPNRDGRFWFLRCTGRDAPNECPSRKSHAFTGAITAIER